MPYRCHDWRLDPATEKQKAYIAEMQEFSEYPLPLFAGKTKGEAMEYIAKYIKIAHERILEHHEDWGGYSWLTGKR